MRERTHRTHIRKSTDDPWTHSWTYCDAFLRNNGKHVSIGHSAYRKFMEDPKTDVRKQLSEQLNLCPTCERMAKSTN